MGDVLLWLRSWEFTFRICTSETMATKSSDHKVREYCVECFVTCKRCCCDILPFELLSLLRVSKTKHKDIHGGLTSDGIDNLICEMQLMKLQWSFRSPKS